MGRSSATVIAGPMPGSTPTAVPSSTPIAAYSRFIGVAASAKPWSSQLKLSMSGDSEPGVDGVEAGQRQYQAADEVADVVVTAEDRCGACEDERARDHPPQWV